MPASSGARTIGFFFADLRGYTEFVEANGDAAAAALLARYRALVRDAVARHEGAEIRTEGDSFYVVFPSVSAAVACGLEIVRDADPSIDGGAAIHVGIGVHAGETVETAEGFVGSAVNIAARICSRAKAGEVLVSDTVRSLTRTSAEFHFEPRGSPPLKGVSEAIPLHAAFPGARGGSARKTRNPYKGLRPFGEEDSADFFGREALIEHLLDGIRRVARAGRLLAVVGPGGSGKSSVVRAGVVPALRSGAIAGSERWKIAVMYPGSRPLAELAAALRSLGLREKGNPAEEPARDGEVDTIAEQGVPGDDALLLVIDQFEELFTVARDATAAARFLESLGRELSAPAGRLTVVATIRADFLDRLLLDPNVGELVRSGIEAVTPLTRAELERAITMPAAASHLEIEPGLPAEILADIVGRPSALPLLQFALTELSDRRDPGGLTRAGYAAIGGLLGALARRADAIYEGLDPDQRVLARQMLLRLVAVGQTGEPVSRRVLRSELRAVAGDGATMDELIDLFGRWRLLTFDRDGPTWAPTVEVAHEALMARWPRLSGWVEEEREAIWMRRRLADAAAEWAAASGDPGYLLAGSRLDLFEGWAATTDLRLTPPERDFLAASLAERRSLDAAEAERVAHERSLENRAARRLRALVGVFAAASLVAASLLVVVYGQNQSTVEQQAIARARELAAASIGNVATNPTLGLLLAVEAGQVTSDRGYIVEEAFDALHSAIQAAQVAYPVRDGPAAVRSGAGGSYGIYLLPAPELMRLALANAKRSLSAEECSTYLHATTCPPPSVPADAELSIYTRKGRVQVGGLATASLQGTRVRIAVDVPGDLAPLVSAWEAQTGIDVTLEHGDVDEVGDLDPAAMPDAAIVSRPALIADLARAGRLIDLGAFLDPAATRGAVGDYLASLGTISPGGGWPAPAGTVYGAPIAASIETLVWYAAPAFRQAGYRIPTTWDELLSESRRIVEDGRTPWCIGVDPDPTAGSAATRWIEGLVLSAAGPDLYDRWTAGTVPFTDSAIRDAFRRFSDLVTERGFVLGGPASLPLTPERLAPWPMLDAPSRPSCFFTAGTSIERGSWPPALTASAREFGLPAVDPRFGPATVGAAYLVVELHDRPEVRDLVRFLAGNAFAAELGRATDSAGLVPVRAVQPSVLRDDVDRAQASRLQAALGADMFRVAATDMMAPEAAAEFSRAILAYIADQDTNLDRVLSDLQLVRSTGAVPRPQTTLVAHVRVEGSACEYQGPQVVPDGSDLAIDFTYTRTDFVTLRITRVKSGTSWEDAVEASRNSMNHPGWIDETSVGGIPGPGSRTFHLESATGFDSYLVGCSDTPAALIRLVSVAGDR